MTLALLTNALTSQAEMERRMSALGIERWSDHEGVSVADANIVNDCINWATTELELTVGQKYSREAMAGHELVRHWATILACYFLTTVRGMDPPASLLRQYEMILEQMERVASGERAIVDLAQREDFRPTVSNRQIDRRWRRRTVRVQTESSGGPTSKLSQRKTRDYYWPF